MKIHGERFAVNARVAQLHQFSAHGDRSDLLSWLKNFPRCRGVHLVHGEPEVARSFATTISNHLGLSAHVAEDAQTVELGV